MFDSYKIIFYLFSCSLCQSNHHHLIHFIIQQSILSATLQSLLITTANLNYYTCRTNAITVMQFSAEEYLTTMSESQYFHAMYTA